MPRMRCCCGIAARGACATTCGTRSRCIRRRAWPCAHRRSRALAGAVSTDLMATDFDAYTAAERAALLAAYPRGSGFREAFLDTVARGVEHRPQSTFGTWSADVLERADPDFHRPNFCGRVLGARWTDA
jgi:hypothetical protein